MKMNGETFETVSFDHHQGTVSQAYASGQLEKMDAFHTMVVRNNERIGVCVHHALRKRGWYII